MWNWGIAADVSYNILSPGGSNIETTVLMELWEEGTSYEDGGVADGMFDGPSNQYADSQSPYAANDGVFDDGPVTACWDQAFSGAGSAQTIKVYVGNNLYTVRPSQRITISSSSDGPGSLGNGHRERSQYSAANHHDAALCHGCRHSEVNGGSPRGRGSLFPRPHGLSQPSLTVQPAAGLRPS